MSPGNRDSSATRSRSYEVVGRTARRAFALVIGGLLVIGQVATAQSPATGITDPSQATIDWQRYSGTTLSVVLNQHPVQQAIEALIPEFEALTGITVKAEILPEGQYFDKVQLALSSGSGAYDVLMTSPLVSWSYNPGGWLQPLDSYLADPVLTDQAWYRVDDFYPNLMAAFRWSGEVGGGVGEGSQVAVPVAAETYIVAYRKDLFDQAAITAPATWTDLAAACQAVQDAGGGPAAQFSGIVARGVRDDTADTGFIAGLTTWGGADFGANLESAINSPVAVEFSQYWLDLMAQCGPTDWSNIAWYDMVQRFADGKAGIVIDADNFAPATYEDPAISKVAGKVAYAPVPAGPQGQEGKTDMAAWSLAIASASQNKDAAWQFVQWASSPYILRRAALEHRVFTPTRQSVWDDPDVTALAGAWGDGSYKSAVVTSMTSMAALRATPEPLYGQVYGIWSSALQDAYHGKPLQQALDEAAAEINDLVAQAGLRD